MNKQTTNIVVLIAIAVIFIGAFFMFSYKGKTAKIAELSDEIGQLDKKLQEAEENRQKLQLLKREIEDLKLALKYAREKLPSEEEITLLLDNINKLGTIESNISITSFKPLNKITREIYYEKPYSMKIFGSFHQIATFFNKIGNLNRIINIDKLSISPSKGNFEAVSLELKTYIYNDPSVTGGKSGSNRGTR
jgi:type IV pilus assembly protein PilO